MKVFAADKIRNVAILGHGSVGKTTLVEAMAYLSGITTRMGNVADGNTVSDFDKEEQKRHFSISTSLIPIIWNDTKINVLDTPGYFDFVGEVEEAISAADAAIIVISGKSGVEVGTQKAWALCEKYNVPRMFYVSNMDAEHANFTEIMETLTDLYGKKVAPLYLPIRENDKLTGYADVIRQCGKKYTEKGKTADADIPGDVADALETYREALIESVAETSEEMMDRYFDGEEFSVDEIVGALKTNIADDSIIPVTLGASTSLQGVPGLLDDIVNYLPAPTNRKLAGENTKSGDSVDCDYNAAGAKAAFVFKTIVDPFIGKYSLVKVASGVIKPDDTLLNIDTDNEFRPGKLYVLEGSKPQEVPELQAGDIGAISKLDASTGDSLATKAAPIRFAKPDYSVPYTYKRYSPLKKGEDDKAASGLTKLMQEDVTLKIVNDAENRQTLIYGMGDQHLDITVSKLLSKYKVEIEMEKPRVAFRETLRKNSDVDSKYKKQSGGHGQYGHVKMKFEPSGDLETPYVFEQIVVGGAVPKNYFPAVEKGIQDSVLKGPLAGYPVVGVKAILYDGSYHPVDSSEMAFKTASSMAFKKGFMEASPVLLEPIASMKVTVPDKFTGDVMGDLNKRRGRVLGMNPDHKGNTIIEADVPMSEIYGYSTQLRSMTGGAGDFAYEFARYEQAPADVQEKEVAARAAEEDE